MSVDWRYDNIKSYVGSSYHMTGKKKKIFDLEKDIDTYQPAGTLWRRYFVATVGSLTTFSKCTN
jgi:hypothetical protein